MKSTDHLKMPELISTQYEVALSDAERDRYENLKQELILQLPDGEITACQCCRADREALPTCERCHLF